MGYFSTAGAVPAELPISCDLRRFVQSENAGIIVLLAVRRARGRAAEAAVYEAVYFDVSAGINAGYGPRKRSPAASRRR
jgi:hypothetical protein